MDQPRVPHPRSRLFVTSAALLFTELLLLRWIPANVTYVGFFANFLLVGSFLGIGTGILLGRRGFEPRFPAFGLLLFAVVLLVMKAQLDVQVKTDEEVYFGLAESHAAAVNFVVLPVLVSLSALVLAALALPLGPLLRASPPLTAYAIDIAGSLAGIAAFTALSAFGTSPVAWFSVLAGLVAVMGLLRGLRLTSLLTAALLGGCILLNVGSGNIWSPYYRITLHRPDRKAEWINVNGIPHQVMNRVASLVAGSNPYTKVFEWFPDRHFDKVCVVGAGSGTDLANLLAHGVGSIDAVEIDPVIAAIGSYRHPDRPYQDSRVTLHVDDGRSFIKKTDTRYDLVVFALPDSLTLASGMADVRLESFLFTQEAFQDVRAHLKPGGLFLLYNFYRQPWIIARIATLLERAFGKRPLVTWNRKSALAVLADGESVEAPPLDETLTNAALPDLPRDDWPFLYLRRPTIPLHYLASLACVLAFAGVMLGAAKRATGLAGFSAHFFALGAAFMLLETRSLVAFSLLFGTTWLVNSLAFFAILVSVLAAIGVTALVKLPRRLLYVALFLALALGWAVPPESLLIEPRWLRYVLASAIAFAPIFFANLVFTDAFKESDSADMAFASNLMGATLGGALEYTALLTGYRALAVVTAALYAIAFFTRRNEDRPA